jgi:hypothetical protein
VPCGKAGTGKSGKKGKARRSLQVSCVDDITVDDFTIINDPTGSPSDSPTGMTVVFIADDDDDFTNEEPPSNEEIDKPAPNADDDEEPPSNEEIDKPAPTADDDEEPPSNEELDKPAPNAADDDEEPPSNEGFDLDRSQFQGGYGIDVTADDDDGDDDGDDELTNEDFDPLSNDGT